MNLFLLSVLSLGFSLQAIADVESYSIVCSSARTDIRFEVAAQAIPKGPLRDAKLNDGVFPSFVLPNGVSSVDIFNIAKLPNETSKELADLYKINRYAGADILLEEDLNKRRMAELAFQSHGRNDKNEEFFFDVKNLKFTFSSYPNNGAKGFHRTGELACEVISKKTKLDGLFW